MTATVNLPPGPRIFDADTDTYPPRPGTGLFDADADTRDMWVGSPDQPGPVPGTSPLPPDLRDRYTVLGERDQAAHGQARLYYCAAVADGREVVIRRSWVLQLGVRGHLHQHELDLLNHDNVIHSLQASIEHEDSLFEVLEFCRGGSLAQRQRPGGDLATVGRTHDPMPEAELHSVIRAMAGALRYLHEDRNVLHTDIKPDNILVRSDGSICLADFGSAVSSINPPPVTFASARTPQFSPEDRAFSPSWDWYQVGLTLIALATGNHDPARDRPTRQDFDALNPRLSLLIRGLLTPWSDGQNRWGLVQVERWLDGEDVLLTGVDIADRIAPSHGQFVVHFEGRDCLTPDELGDRMSENWEAALRAVQGFLGSEPFLAAVADQLRTSGDPREVAIRDLMSVTVGDPSQAIKDPGTGRMPLVEQPDIFLARVVCALNPRGVPKYSVAGGAVMELTHRGLLSVARECLDAMDAQDTDHPSVVLQERLIDLGLLRVFAQMQGFYWLADLDTDWREASRDARRRLALAVPGVQQYRADRQHELETAGRELSGRLEFQEGEWERFAGVGSVPYSIRLRSQVLAALADDGARAQLAASASSLIGDSELVAQSWFAQLAGLAPPRPRRPHGSGRGPWGGPQAGGPSPAQTTLVERAQAWLRQLRRS